MKPKKSKKNAPQSSAPQKPRLFVLLLIVLVLAVFSPCLGAKFLGWDDYNHFVSNPCVYSLSWYNLINLFQQTINNTYIPLTTVSFNVEYHLFGLSPLIAHLINVLLHAAVVLAIFDLALALKFSGWEAFAAAAIFAVHPMHVESVAWVTERKDVLGILFYVLCMKQYWLYLQSGSKKRYALSVLLAFLSVLTKAMAVSIPWVLLLLDWFYQRRWSKRVLQDKLPFAAFVFPIALITFFKLSPHPHIAGTSVLIGLWTFSWYLGKLFLPIDLLPAYSPALPVTLSNPSYALSLIVSVIFICALWVWRRNRLFIFASFFWMATIFFFWRFDFADNNIVADRFMYLPSLGFCLWLGFYSSRSKVITGLIIIVLSCLTFNQCGVWKNDLTLWTWTLAHDPRNVIAKGNQDEAIDGFAQKHFDYQKLTTAIDKNPGQGRVYFDRGAALLREGDYFLAFNDFNRALRLDPSNSMAYTMRGQLYVLRGQGEKALDDLNKAIALDPHNALAYVQKASVLEGLHDVHGAFILFEKAVKANPSLGAVYYQRGMLYARLGDYTDAVSEFTKAISLNSNLKNSYYQRAQSYEALKQFHQAQEDLGSCLAQDPYDVKVLNEMGVAYLMQGQEDKALGIFNRAIAMHPYYDDAYINRGIVDIHQKKYDLALKDYTQAINRELYPYHALITRGDIYFVLGDKVNALKDYDRAVLFSQGDPVAQMRRERLMGGF